MDVKLSVVSTLYNSAPFLKEFYQRIREETQKITQDFEIILVNDGSPDNSLDVALSFYENDPKVRILDLSRNFGHHKAIMTGLSFAKGDLVFLIDSDLEEEPELLSTFYAEWVRSGPDVIYGKQASRRGRWMERLTGEMFYWLFNKISTNPLPRNAITARLMTSTYVTALVEHRDKEVFLAGLYELTGFKQIAVTVDKLARNKSSYTLRRKINIAVTSITSFSSTPLVFIFYVGILISSMSMIAALYLIIRRMFFGIYLAGWPSLIVSIWFLSGIIIFCLGVIGIYLSKVFMEVKDRPYTIVRRFYDHSQRVDTKKVTH